MGGIDDRHHFPCLNDLRRSQSQASCLHCLSEAAQRQVLQRQISGEIVTNKYQAGNYMVVLFDRYGTKIDTVLVTAGGLLKAQEKGLEMRKEGLCASFCVIRVLHNSLD